MRLSESPPVKAAATVIFSPPGRGAIAVGEVGLGQAGQSGVLAGVVDGNAQVAAPPSR